MADWIRSVFKKKPLVGFCFGHQIIAHALGGTAEKAPTGLIVGVQEYQTTEGAKYAASSWHNDQVTKIPQGASATASGNNCPFAALSYSGDAISFQCHPEFSDEYMADLYNCHSDLVPAPMQAEYLHYRDSRRVDNSLGEEVAAFFVSHQ